MYPHVEKRYEMISMMMRQLPQAFGFAAMAHRGAGRDSGIVSVCPWLQSLSRMRLAGDG